jgi:CubicO group peptidase (beta-lactamase class C family)
MSSRGARSPRADESPGHRRSGALAALLVALAALTIGSASLAGSPGTEGDIADAASEDPDELAAFVDGVLEEVVGEAVPGATVAIVEGDALRHARGYGVADVTTGDPVSADGTAFMIGSVAKPVTFTAVMQGVEDGTLDLDVDVAHYLRDSEVDVAHHEFGPITLRHLGTHTAGFETVLNPGIVDDPDGVPSLEQAAASPDRPDRVREPGLLVGYSNYGTLLAGHVVEQAEGVPFDDLVRERIFEPLGMHGATFEQPVPDGHPVALTASHVGGDGEFERVEPVYIGWRPAGAMSATATDMAAFMSAHLGDGAHGGARILEPETLALMHDRHHERHPEVAGLRYGFFEHHRNTEAIRHDGATFYDSAELLLFPEQDLGVFVAFNIRNPAASPMETAERIAEGLGAFPEPADPGAADVPGGEERTEVVAGEYRPTLASGPGLTEAFGLGQTVTITSEGDGEITVGSLEAEYRFVETAPYVFHEVDGHDVVAAEVDGGEATMLHLSSVTPTTFLPVAATERLPVLAVMLLVPVTVFLASLLAWTVSGLRRRWRGRTAAADASSGGSSPERGSGAGRRDRGSMARASGVGLSLAAVGWVAMLGWAFTYGNAVAMEPFPVLMVYALPYVIAVSALATVWGAVVLWRRRLGTRGRRVHQSVLAVAGVLLLWPLLVVGLL